MPFFTAAVLITLLTFGCGNSLVPGTSYQQPLLSFSGTINPGCGLLQAERPIVGHLWTDPLQRKPDLPMPARWLRSSVNATNDTFSVDIFRQPPPGATIDLADSAGNVSQMGLAEIVIVDDRDGDGTFLV